MTNREGTVTKVADGPPDGRWVTVTGAFFMTGYRKNVAFEKAAPGGKSLNYEGKTYRPGMTVKVPVGRCVLIPPGTPRYRSQFPRGILLELPGLKERLILHGTIGDEVSEVAAMIVTGRLVPSPVKPFRALLTEITAIEPDGWPEPIEIDLSTLGRLRPAEIRSTLHDLNLTPAERLLALRLRDIQLRSW